MSVQSRTHWAMAQKQGNHTLSRSFASILKLSAGLVACFLWFFIISTASLGAGTVLCMLGCLKQRDTKLLSIYSFLLVWDCNILPSVDW